MYVMNLPEGKLLLATMFKILLRVFSNCGLILQGVTGRDDEQMWERLASNIQLFSADAILPYRSSFSFYAR